MPSRTHKAAAFGRLCVETAAEIKKAENWEAAAFGRLCVETFSKTINSPTDRQPPSGGCVLKHLHRISNTL